MENKALFWMIVALSFLMVIIGLVIVLVSIFNAGEQYEIKRLTCAYEICGMDKQEHDSYFYADVDDYCYCFLQGELDFVENVNHFLE